MSQGHEFVARECAHNTPQCCPCEYHWCQDVDMDMIIWSQATWRHCYQIAGATEYFDHIKMWPLMSRADVRNYKLSHSHSTDQCAWVQNTVLSSSRDLVHSCVQMLVEGVILKESYEHYHSWKQTNNVSLTSLLSISHTCCGWRSGLWPVRALKFCDHAHDFSLHWHLLWEQRLLWGRRWMENEGGGISSYSWWMRNKWKTGSTDRAETCVRKQKCGY